MLASSFQVKSEISRENAMIDTFVREQMGLEVRNVTQEGGAATSVYIDGSFSAVFAARCPSVFSVFNSILRYWSPPTNAFASVASKLVLPGYTGIDDSLVPYLRTGAVLDRNDTASNFHSPATVMTTWRSCENASAPSSCTPSRPSGTQSTRSISSW